MQMLKNQLASDALKLSKTPFFILHLALPALGIALFFAYQSISTYAPEHLATNYYQLLALIYPLLAAWLCSLVVEQEIEAGGGFFLLSLPSRKVSLFSKLLFLLLGGLLACLAVVLGYNALVIFVWPDYQPSLFTAILIAFIIWACSLFLYEFHLWLGLRFGQSISFAVAAFEVLLSALMITGLGESVWFFVPSAWGIKLVRLVSDFFLTKNAATLLMIELGFAAAALTTLLMTIFLFKWFTRWEGRSLDE